jgi:TetR/AcrR family acrAB operon transcriptional repressor
MARATKEEALETRNRIIDAAEEVMFARGVAQTSLADVADAAGVTRGAIYWHFKNKAICSRRWSNACVCRWSHLMQTPESEQFRERSARGICAPPGCVCCRTSCDEPRTRRVLDILFLEMRTGRSQRSIWIRQNECYLNWLKTTEGILQEAISRSISCRKIWILKLAAY